MRRRRRISEKIGLLCLALVVGLGGIGVSLAHWQETLTIGGTIGTGVWDNGGTCGFWKNWSNHNPPTQDEIQVWLTNIDNNSDWLNATTTAEMEAIFDDATGGGATMEQKFLAHYLATRLNAASGRLLSTTPRYFASYDSHNYLGLGGNGTLQEIIIAIEGMYPLLPAEDYEDEFETMKNICDGLNNLQISPWPFP